MSNVACVVFEGNTQDSRPVRLFRQALPSDFLQNIWVSFFPFRALNCAALWQIPHLYSVYRHQAAALKLDLPPCQPSERPRPFPPFPSRDWFSGYLGLH